VEALDQENGGPLYPDYEEEGLYYFTPEIELGGRMAGGAAFSFLKIVGTNETAGDEASLGGMLAFTLAQRDPGAARAAQWKRAIPSASRFLPLPAKRLRADVLLHRLEGGPVQIGRNDAPWSERTFRIPLSGVDASKLWKELDGSHGYWLSVEIELDTPGFEGGPQALLEIDALAEGPIDMGVPEAPGTEPGPDRFTRTDRFSVPVHVNRRSHPDAFKLVNRDEKKSFTYRSLSVSCFDWVNELAGDVWRIVVEIEVRNERDQRRIETVAFEIDTDPQVDLYFSVPEARGSSYRYRTTHHPNEGEALETDWMSGDAAYLDVSRYELDLGP